MTPSLTLTLTLTLKLLPLPTRPNRTLSPNSRSIRLIVSLRSGRRELPADRSNKPKLSVFLSTTGQADDVQLALLSLLNSWLSPLLLPLPLPLIATAAVVQLGKET